MYEANGVTAGFPLPQGSDGSTVVLISPVGQAVKAVSESYTVQDGAVFFNVPPPAGWIVAFEMPANTPALSVCTVVYPDGTMKQLDKDPWELLVEAKTERDEAKKLLRDANNAIDAAERVVHVESEIAKEKLSARLEKYGSLVEDSIAQAANGAKNELQNYLAQQIEEVRTKHDEVMKARDDSCRNCMGAHNAADQAASEAQERVQAAFEAKAAQAIEAYERTKAMRSEILDFRDEAQSAAATTAVKLQETIAAYMTATLEQARSLRTAVEHEIDAKVSKANAEASGLVEQIKAAKDAAQAAANRVLEVEKRCVEMDKAQAAREIGMQALWTRIAGFKKNFDHRVSQMRGAAVETAIGEGEEQA